MTEPRIWDYKVTDLVRIVDGDTYILTLQKRMDFGFYLIEDKQWTSRFRLVGVDTPEPNEAGGSAATQFATEWIKSAIADDVLRCQSHKTDNFGRWLIEIYRADTSARLTKDLVDFGHATVRLTR